jgi:hypothetical protein
VHCSLEGSFRVVLFFVPDEYTRITTPRQDVLFKKGYLNKPKTYQTQTSTGNSTTSTGNSTGNGTPDHQSTGTPCASPNEQTTQTATVSDLEYESQFVFPNGFVDQNGIYYVNSEYKNVSPQLRVKKKRRQLTPLGSFFAAWTHFKE